MLYGDGTMQVHQKISFGPLWMAWRRPLACLLVVSGLAGCSTVSLSPEQAGRSSSGNAGGTVRPDRDGAPERPPEDLATVPDAVPRVEPILPKGPNKPYVVLGQGYEPLAEDVPFKQQGMASWYGTKFHGRRTASGEVYSMYGMSAAHRTLPIPSYARVRNKANGKEVIVRINDRGPFHSSRVLDLSYTAAAKLDVLARGQAEVEIERLTFEDIRTGRWVREPGQAPAPIQEDPIQALASHLDGAQPSAVVATAPLQESDLQGDAVAVPPSVPLASAPSTVRPIGRSRAFTPGQQGFWVQLAAFSQRAGVDAFQKRVAAELSNLAPLLAVFQEGPGYRLQVGPYARREDAQGAAHRVREALQLSPMVVERR
jgi:rare lipoprotein A